MNLGLIYMLTVALRGLSFLLWHRGQSGIVGLGSRTVRARHPHTQHHHLNTLSRYRNIAHIFTHAFNFPKSTPVQISYLIDLQRDNLLEISATKTSSGLSLPPGSMYANCTHSISKD